MRLVGTGEGARLGGAGRAGAQGRIPPVEHKQAAYARDGGTVNLQGVGDGGILPCWTIRPFVGFEQGAGMGKLPSGSGAAGDEAVEDGAVVIGEEDAVEFLAQSEPPSSADAATGCGTPTIPENRNAVNLPCQNTRA